MTRLTRRTFTAAGGAALAAPYVTRASAAVDPKSVGEMLVIGFNGATADAAGAQTLARHVGAGKVGGVCFLGHNARSREGVEGLTRLFNSAGRASKVLVAIDQEGGAVQRLGSKIGYPAVPTALSIADHNEPAGARAIYARMARELRAAGFNFNLAPVVDLGFEPKNPIVAHFGRAFGGDGATVARYGGAFVQGHRDASVLTALKHFPGHGSTLVDSHARPVDLTATWRADEIEPYRALAKAGLIDVVMSGHLIHAKYTAGLPATLSPAAIEGWLRRDIGYDGVAMTDDLDMAAIRSSYSLNEAVVRAVAAGNDLILLSNSRDPDPDLPDTLAAAVREAVASGRIAPGRVEAAAARVRALKARV